MGTVRGIPWPGRVPPSSAGPGRSENYWTQATITLALGLGLLATWCPDSRRLVGSRGFPDVVAAGPRGLLFGELKMPGGETSPHQDYWAWMLEEPASPGVHYRLWTVPHHFNGGQIERDLRMLL